MSKEKDRDAAELPDRGQLFKLLAEAVREYMGTNVDEEAVRRIAGEEMAKRYLPQVLELRFPDGTSKAVEGAHAQFTELLGMIEEGHRNLMLVGPAGSGKTTLAKTAAHAMNLPFGFLSLSAGVTETHLLGRVLPQADGSWQYQKSLFVKIYEEGGVFLLDEIDAADANVMVAINAALANGVLANPISGTVHPRHKDTYIIAAANTWGRGADAQYAGRNALDASTLDRFVLSTLHVKYDTVLERMLAQASLPEAKATELLDWLGELREAIDTNRLRRVASTRLLVNATAALKAGRSLADVKERYFQDWSKDERAKAGV
jgi:cobaltochelatase CobS